MAEVQTFFFKAMLRGYAGDVKPGTIPGMPSHKANFFRDEDFYLLNRWSVTPGSLKSTGTTTIWFQNAPVWVMNYGGYYEKNVIPFLKQALRKTYVANEFVGGRGPNGYIENLFTYTNNPRLNDFEKFEGREEVTEKESLISLGYHEYWGMSLI